MSDTPNAPVGISLEEFRKRQIRDFIFPNSGLAVKIKNVSLIDLVVEGVIPQTLVGLFQKVRDANDDDKARMSMEKLPELVPALNSVAKAVIVEPPVAEEPDETHLGVTEIPFADRLALFHEMNTGAEALANFRQQPDGDADAGHGGEPVSPEAEPDPGD